MKPKWIFTVLAGLMICSIFSTSQGADKFYYGSYLAKVYEHIPWQRDSLKFNILHSWDINASDAESLAKYSMRAIPENSDDQSPKHWSQLSHYTLWEAEGLEESWVNLQYNGGTLVNDPSASGGKARKFSGPGTPDTIQWGPRYYQEPKYSGVDEISYTAEFCLKYHYNLSKPRGSRGSDPPTPVCCIMVVDRGTILMADTLYKNDFPGSGIGGYETFELIGYTVPDDWNNRTEFKIYWFAPPEAVNFWIDCVKVYDQNGWELIDQKWHDEELLDYVSQSWVNTTKLETGETVVYRWYMRDQPLSIDCFAPYAYIDDLLWQVSTERVGMQAYCQYTNDTLTHEYFLRENPQEYHIDPYPTWISQFGTDSSGATYQQGMDTYISWLKRGKENALTNNKDFWVTYQAFAEGHEISNPSGYPPYSVVYYENDSLQHSGWYWFGGWNREPTPNEVRLQSFLALCYGARSLMCFRYLYTNFYDATQGKWFFGTGLYDQFGDSLTAKWRELKDFTSPRIDKLGPTIKNLTWQGACSDDSVGSLISYIDSIRSSDPEQEPHWVEVGSFSADTGEYTNYFMLVNRECLEDEGADYDVFFTDQRGLYRIRDMYTDSIIAVVEGSGDQFVVHLEPGEGKLFRLEPRLFSSHVIQVPQDSSCIQCAIDGAQNGDTVLVAPGTYKEGIDFLGKAIVVGSYYLLFPESEYISQTRVDPAASIPRDSVSVVTFNSGEDSNSVIAGLSLQGGTGYCWWKIHERLGGGIFCYGSSPIIRNNIIQSNHAEGLPSGAGGGIYCQGTNCAPMITCNIIRFNESNFGGGIYSSGSSAKIINNLISWNSAFQNEESEQGGYGGGIECYGHSRVSIVNNTIDSNYAYLFGAGIDVDGSSCVYLINNIISNSRVREGIYAHDDDDTVYVSYCDFWENGYNNTNHFGGAVTAEFGDTTWGENRNGIPCDSFYNIFRNPDYVNGHHLDDSSVCVDVGDNDAPSLPETDVDGNPRVVDGNGNDSAFVDMGAYEYQPGGFGGFGKIVGSDREDNETKSSASIPDEFSLSQNYPNPFNPATAIKFNVQDSKFKIPTHTTLKIYNILGQVVRVLVDEEKSAGSHTVYWDGNDKNGQPVSSGIYFYRLDVGDFTEVKKMVLLK